MKFWGQLTGVSAAILLSACGGSNQASPTPATPQLLAQVTTVNGVTTFSGNRANYTITKTSTGYTVTDKVGTDGVSNLTAPTRLIFADVGIAFDLSGTAGKAYRVYQAAFNRTPDQGGLGFWVYAMDQGTSLHTVAGGFMASEEFKAKYGANLDNAAFVAGLYANVLHRPLDQGGNAFWVHNLNTKATSAAEVLAAFSESDENKAQVAAATAEGILYTPYAPPPPPLTVAKLATCPDSAVSNQPQFYQCMVGSLTGQTTFGNAPCTLTIANNGTISLAANGNSVAFKLPYYAPIYSKLSHKTPEAFNIAASAGGFVNNILTSIKIKAVSPKYSEFLYGTIPAGVQADTDNLSCKFAL